MDIAAYFANLNFSNLVFIVPQPYVKVDKDTWVWCATFMRAKRIGRVGTAGLGLITGQEWFVRLETERVE